MRNMLFFSALALIACREPSVPVHDVTLLQLEITTPGDEFPQRSSLQLRAHGLMSDGHKVDLTWDVAWRSSNPEVVLVTNEGVAVLRGVGTALITAAIGEVTQTRSLTSTAARVTRVALSPAEKEPLPKGRRVQLHATAYLENGSSRDVTAVARWRSLDAHLAMMEVPGEVAAVLEGLATVQAEFLGVVGAQSFTVSGPIVEGLAIDAPRSLVRPGDLQRLWAAARLSDGVVQPFPKECEWSSSDPSVLRVGSEGNSRGVLVALDAGRATVTVKCDAHVATRDFDVARRVAEALRLSDKLRLAKGAEGQVRAQVRWDDGSVTEAAGEVRFSSSAPDVATVSPQGLVRAVGEGVACLRATLGEVSTSVEIAVGPPVLQALSGTLSSARLMLGQRATFAVVGQFSDGTTMNLTSAATFLGGLVSREDDVAVFLGQSPGRVNVEAEVDGRVVDLSFEVTSHVVTGLRLSRRASLDRPGTERLEAIATWSDGVETDATELAEWSSSNEYRAFARNTPGARGFVQSFAGGPVTITCRLGNHSATFDLVFPVTP